ncbi:MAG: glucosamine-6-phosphate deaminase [Patescibacteria group bacterium]|nr:glucosamine-6-phosphate deaminase [Patescibacteria group bacterium]
MNIIVAKNYDDLSAHAAAIVADQIIKKPNSVLGLATGATQLGLYQKLVELYHQGSLSFSQVTTFNLDEYFGLANDDSQSYHYFMFENFFKHLDIKKENIFIPAGSISMTEVGPYGQKYEAAIKIKGDLDLQILGIGENGHIGFNEPGSDFNSVTRLVSLSDNTIKANARFFSAPEAVPRQAITMGLATIMSARKIILLASGKSKAAAVAQALSGEVSEAVPASVLQRHQNLTIILDTEAAVMVK